MAFKLLTCWPRVTTYWFPKILILAKTCLTSLTLGQVACSTTLGKVHEQDYLPLVYPNIPFKMCQVSFQSTERSVYIPVLANTRFQPTAPYQHNIHGHQLFEKMNNRSINKDFIIYYFTNIIFSAKNLHRHLSQNQKAYGTWQINDIL